MEKLLLMYRKEFREKFNGIIKKEFFEKRVIDKLLENQIKIEEIYRRTNLLKRINSLGLEKNISKIICGMNISPNTINLVSEGFIVPYEKGCDWILAESDAGLIRGLEYIDKWKMYNELWGNE